MDYELLLLELNFTVASTKTDCRSNFENCFKNKLIGATMGATKFFEENKTFVYMALSL
jgi:hypothetical protein